MKQQLSKILIFTLFGIFSISCNSVKRVADDEYLLTKNTIKINDKKNNTEVINNLLYQEPNRKILGIPLRLHVYNTARPNIDSILVAKLNKTPRRKQKLEKFLSKKQLDNYISSRKSFNEWLKTTGEAPVIVDEERAEKSLKRLQDYHINNGWFNVKSSYNIDTLENKKAELNFDVETGKGFTIDTISVNIASPNVDSLYQKIKNNSIVKSKEQYKTANFQQERERISSELRNNGLYHFNQDYISFEMDTLGSNNKVNVGIQIQDRAIRTDESVRREPFKIFKIRQVNIITDAAFANLNDSFSDSISYNSYKLYSYDKMRYRPKALTDAVFITPHNIFKDIDRTRTYRHISELRSFKYPEIEYIEHPDSTLTANVFLTPLKKFSLGFSADVSQSNIQTFGFSLNPSLSIRNIFGGAEIFEISAIGSIGASKDKNNIEDPFFDINEIGVDLKLTIPRLFSPFYTENIVPKYMSPSTRIGLATTSQTNIGLDKQTFSGSFTYNWNPSNKVTNRLDIFNVQYVRNLNVNNYFRVYDNSYNSLNQIAKDANYINQDDNLIIPEQSDAFINYTLGTPTPSEISENQLKEVNSIDERKTRLTENNLIFASSFSLTNDERTNLFDEDFSIFHFRLELAGNLLSTASKLLGLKKDSNNRYEIFNVAYSQYIKTEIDYIKHWDLGKKNIFAMRSFLGIAIPYGNSNNIPFSKSFFGGGANDNRAWIAYGLGPGSSATNNEFNEANLKLALSIEQRFNLFANLNGAIFVDAGNIWNVLDDIDNEQATFTNFNSLKDIAIGSGFGLRYDFSFFVFRFDLGFKTYDPSYGDNNRWFNDYNFTNAVYNIGINYPF